MIRHLILALSLVASFSSSSFAEASCNRLQAETLAKVDIEYLRRTYAKATDLIGIADDESISKGRKLYHSIFTKDARFSVANPGGTPLEARGPDRWADVVLSVLTPYGPTQHLIGTQLVSIESLELDEDCNPVAGLAHMESYVQAWHDTTPDEIWMFIGTYVDSVIFQPQEGWRIQAMSLVQTTTETRKKVAK